MPPYAKNTSPVISFPRCNWCQTTGAYKCKCCGLYTCNKCLVDIDDADTCTHRKFTSAEDTGWDANDNYLSLR